MRRGTTPTFKIKIDGIRIDELKSIYVTFKQYNTEITKRKEDVEIEENTISVKMSQEETLSFTNGRVNVQIRGLTDMGIAIGSNIYSVQVEDILKDGVIE